jgi:hypothetical protein
MVNAHSMLLHSLCELETEPVFATSSLMITNRTATYALYSN